MFFNKKDNGTQKCENCGEQTSEMHNFCPTCGNSFIEEDAEEFGLLGKNDFSNFEESLDQPAFSLTDKFLTSIMNSMMKNLDKQFREMEKEMQNSTEIKTMPNGIKIKITGPFPAKQKKPQQAPKQKQLDEEQIKKMSAMPREKAKTNVKRLGNKVVYELATPGVASLDDIFISKLESGYEIKAVGNKKVYVNSIPINLPIKSYSILKNKVSVEFLAQENFN